MHQSQTDHYEEMRLAQMAQRLTAVYEVLRAGQRSIGRAVMAAGAIGALMAFGSHPEYVAQARILPYRTSGAAGGISGLAGLAGIRLPSAGTDPTIPPSLYPDVVGSMEFTVEVAEARLRFGELRKEASAVEFFGDLQAPSLFGRIRSYTIGLPGHLAGLFRQAPRPNLSGIAGDSLMSALVDPEYLDVLHQVKDRIDIEVDKKTFIVSIAARMPDPVAAADLVRVTTERLMARIIEYESRKAGEQYAFVRAQHKLARTRYERAQRAAAVFADQNRALSTAVSRIEYDRLQRESELSFEVLQQFERELEQARIKMNQDTPVFTVLERVRVPTDRSSPQRTKILLLSLVLGVLVGALWVGTRHLLLLTARQMPEAP